MLYDKRAAGVLLHISSLPSPYGIGTLGKEAFRFVDFLKESNQTYWQILPISPPSLGNSPYSAFSSYAGNPLFIDLDLLEKDGLLKKKDYAHLNWGHQEDKVNYKAVLAGRDIVLRIAVENFLKKKNQTAYKRFIKQNEHWLNDYSLFMAIHNIHNKEWTSWPKGLKHRDKKDIDAFKKEHHKEITYQNVVQYFFFTQWNELKKYANKNGIEIIGDVPIYVALDSCDVWSNPKLFQLDKEGNPSFVAGCPPDAFSKDGQNWMNPLYNWAYHKKTNYHWWIDRIDHLCHIYDILRIDHFRGFDSYYAIPNPGKAKDGHWRKGPGIELFNALKKKAQYNLIAEDLGFLTDSVIKLLADTGYPGMKIIQFGFDSRDPSSDTYQPHRYPTNCIAYTGTHDNDTLLGYLKSADKADVNLMKEYFGISKDESFNFEVMKGLYASVANTTIVQAQDILSLGKTARMNIPATETGNWVWRAKKEVFTKALAKKLARYMVIYNRIPNK